MFKDLQFAQLVFVLYCHLHTCRMNHNDTMIKTLEDFFRKICTSHFIVRVRKGYSRFYDERELETEHNCNILTPTLMSVSVVSFSFSRSAQPEAQGPTLLAFSTASYQQLLWTPNHQGLQGPLRPDMAFPTTTRP